MLDIVMTVAFQTWLGGLRDRQGHGRIVKRIDRLRQGHFGLRRVLGHGVWELKLDAGPGYRLYYRLHRRKVVLLLCGGDKGSQKHDIETAMKMARELEASDGH